MVEKTDVVVVGGGQAGIAASEHLTKANINHIVLERARTAEHWRTMRWDSLVANGPASVSYTHLTLPTILLV